MQNSAIQQLKNHYQLHTYKAGQKLEKPSIPSGFNVLDETLPSSGWPLGQLVEIFIRQSGCGELNLLLPALTLLSRRQQWLALVAPPLLPYIPAWIQAGVNPQYLFLTRPSDAQTDLWAMEQILKSCRCAALIAWPDQLTMQHSRRLHLAAQQAQAFTVLLRYTHNQQQPTCATLKIRLEAQQLTILKCPGLASQAHINLTQPKRCRVK